MVSGVLERVRGAGGGREGAAARVTRLIALHTARSAASPLCSPHARLTLAGVLSLSQTPQGPYLSCLSRLSSPLPPRRPARPLAPRAMCRPPPWLPRSASWPRPQPSAPSCTACSGPCPNFHTPRMVRRGLGGGGRGAQRAAARACMDPCGVGLDEQPHSTHTALYRARHYTPSAPFFTSLPLSRPPPSPPQTPCAPRPAS
jgi:hypothetical protein